MRARSVPPTPSFNPAPPPVLARTSSTLVLSRRSSQRIAALPPASCPWHAIPLPRAHASHKRPPHVETPVHGPGDRPHRAAGAALEALARLLLRRPGVHGRARAAGAGPH